MRPGETFSPKGLFVGSFVPNWLMAFTGVPATAKLVYARAASLDNGSGRVRFDQGWMAAQVGADVRTVRRAVDALEQAELLRIERATGAARLTHQWNTYVFLWHAAMDPRPGHDDGGQDDPQPSPIRPSGDALPGPDNMSSPGRTDRPVGDGQDALPNSVGEGSVGEGTTTPPTPPAVAGWADGPSAVVLTGEVVDDREAGSASTTTGAIDAVFDAWVESPTLVGKRRRTATLTKPRRDLIARRLREGYDVATLVAAVQGWVHSPHHRGENDRGTVYDSLDVCLSVEGGRRAANLDQFAAYHRDPASRPTGAPVSAREAGQRARIARREQAGGASRLPAPGGTVLDRLGLPGRTA